MSTRNLSDIMRKEKSVGAIVFYNRKTPEFLLLHYVGGHWDLCKGHVEKGEENMDTLKREIFEETKTKKFDVIPVFREEINYSFKSGSHRVSKEVIFYLVEFKSKHIKISFEHQAFGWFSYEEALNKLTFDTAKGILKKANDFLDQ